MTLLRKLADAAALVAGAAAAIHAKWPSDTPDRTPELTPEDRAYVDRWVADEVRRLRELSYEELLRHEGQDLHCAGITPSGADVMRETTVVWDDRGRRNLHVFVDAVQWRSGLLGSSLIKHDFIRAPDGSFIDE